MLPETKEPMIFKDQAKQHEDFDVVDPSTEYDNIRCHEDEVPAWAYNLATASLVALFFCVSIFFYLYVGAGQ